MAKAKPTKGRKPASKATKAPSGATAAEGIEAAKAYNESIEQSGDATAPEGVVTWPTRYGNPDMAIPPATPTKIVDGHAVPVTNVDDAPEPDDEAA